MSEITQFRGILPPEGTSFGGRPYAPPPSKASPGGLILNALHPLRGDLETALTRGDHQTALCISYTALGNVVDAMAAHRGDRVQPWQVLIHALLIDLTPLPYELGPDGALSERGTAVQVSYRNWIVDRREAGAFARKVTDRLRALWPDAWVVVSPVGAGPSPAAPKAGRDG